MPDPGNDPSRDPLIRHLDEAAEHVRQINHQTYRPREVTDLHDALAALATLVHRLPQLLAYLATTVDSAAPEDFRHGSGGDPATALLTAGYQLGEARNHVDDLAAALKVVFSEISHLALDLREWVCPECGEPAERGMPIDLTAVQRLTAPPRYAHSDGTQLCPVMGPDGYRPAEPTPAHS